MKKNGPELIVGLVSPVGMDTTQLANAVQGALSGCNYTAVPIKTVRASPRQWPATAR